jgi:uncharacterized protein YndB with AHSA1/START domain
MAVQTMEPFVTSRVFDAPRERVWQAWTDPEHLKHWWGPKDFKVHTCKVDLRPGGIFHYWARESGRTRHQRSTFLKERNVMKTKPIPDGMRTGDPAPRLRGRG